MNPDAPKNNKTIMQKIFAKLRRLLEKNSDTDDLQGATPKDLTPEDVIELFDLQPDEIPPRVEETPGGIPSHIKVENKVYISHATPEEYYARKGDEEE